MLLGHFQIITSFLSLYPWSVAARLTFVIYLIHYSIINIVQKSQKNVMEINTYNNIRDTIYFFIISAVCAVPIVLIIEMPVGNMEKIMFTKAQNTNKGEKLIEKNVDLELKSGS